MSDYFVVGAHSIFELQRLVNGYIREGCSPLGGVACIYREIGSPNYHFFQAMIRSQNRQTDTLSVE